MAGHGSAVCKAGVPKCVGCGGDHEAWSRTCPTFLSERERLKEHVLGRPPKENVSQGDSRREVPGSLKPPVMEGTSVLSSSYRDALVGGTVQSRSPVNLDSSLRDIMHISVRDFISLYGERVPQPVNHFSTQTGEVRITSDKSVQTDPVANFVKSPSVLMPDNQSGHTTDKSTQADLEEGLPASGAASPADHSGEITGPDVSGEQPVPDTGDAAQLERSASAPPKGRSLRKEQSAALSQHPQIATLHLCLRHTRHRHRRHKHRHQKQMAWVAQFQSPVKLNEDFPLVQAQERHPPTRHEETTKPDFLFLDTKGKKI